MFQNTEHISLLPYLRGCIKFLTKAHASVEYFAYKFFCGLKSCLTGHCIIDVFALFWYTHYQSGLIVIFDIVVINQTIG